MEPKNARLAGSSTRKSLFNNEIGTHACIAMSSYSQGLLRCGATGKILTWVTWIGLLGKNAVLIVQFAVQKPHPGSRVLEAAEAAESCHRWRGGTVSADPDDVVRLHCSPDPVGGSSQPCCRGSSQERHPR